MLSERNVLLFILFFFKMFFKSFSERFAMAFSIVDETVFTLISCSATTFSKILGKYGRFSCETVSHVCHTCTHITYKFLKSREIKIYSYLHFCLITISLKTTAIKYSVLLLGNSIYLPN